MRILDDGPAGAGAHEFAVELRPHDEQARELWESAADRGDYVVPHAMVRCEDGKIDPAPLRASLGRFNGTSGDGWRWTVEALAAHLLHDLCGVALVGWLEPPDSAAVAQDRVRTDPAGGVAPPGSFGRRREIGPKTYRKHNRLG